MSLAGDVADKRVLELGSAAGVLSEPLTNVPDDYVDLVVASLVLHYVEDWVPLLGELRCCRVPGGRLVFSVHHPAADLRLFDSEDYLRTEEVEDIWDIEGEQLAVSFYRRPLLAIFGQLARTAFTVDTVAEPRPLPELAEVDPQAFEVLSTQPAFLFICAEV